jgi:cytochrome P450
MRKDPLGTLLECSRLGDVARIDFGPRGEAYLVTHPDGVKRVLLDNYTNYTKQTRGFNTLRVFLGQGLLTAEGSFWRRQRRIAQPAFHHGQIRRFAATMARAAEDLADRWEDRARTGEVFDVADDMMQLTLRIVGECLFSTDPSHESSAIGPHVELLLSKFITRITAPMVFPLHWPLPGNRRVRQAIVGMQRIVDEIVAERHRTGPMEQPDLLDMLMSAEDEETGERMNAAQLRDEVLTILVAGHETTAAALGWTWTLLSRHPEVDARLEAELAALNADTVGLDELPQATIVGQVIHEAMRLYPPAWIAARTAAETDEVCGVTIPAGSLTVVSPWATHRRADLFPDPDRFDPARFRPDAGPNGGFSKFAYFPFGGGPRVCIGNGFALMEAQLALAALRRRFRLRLAPGAEVRPLPLLTLRCTPGVHVVAEKA